MHPLFASITTNHGCHFRISVDLQNLNMKKFSNSLTLDSHAGPSAGIYKQNKENSSRKIQMKKERYI